MPFYDIIVLILMGMYIPLGRDIDPGENIPATILRNANTTFRRNTSTINQSERHGCEMCAPVWGAFSCSCIHFGPVLGLLWST